MPVKFLRRKKKKRQNKHPGAQSSLLHSRRDGSAQAHWNEWWLLGWGSLPVAGRTCSLYGAEGPGDIQKQVSLLKAIVTLSQTSLLKADCPLLPLLKKKLLQYSMLVLRMTTEAQIISSCLKCRINTGFWNKTETWHGSNYRLGTRAWHRHACFRFQRVWAPHVKR